MSNTTVLISLFALLLFSCKEDDARTCTTCTSPETFEFEICRESNGNASVNGEDTETNYDLYVAGLEETGTTCGN